MDKIRIYQNKTPELGECIIGKVIDNKNYVKFELVEYNTEGIMVYSEVPRKMVKSIKIGQIYVAEVVNSEKETGIVDLSIKRINKDDEIKIKDLYEKNKHIVSIIHEVSINTGISMEKINEDINWGLTSDDVTSYEYLKNASSDVSMISHLNYSGILFEILQKYFKKEEYKYIKKIKVVCYSSSGIDGIVSSLQKAEELCDVNINYVSSPLYSVESKDENSIAKAIDIIKNEIVKCGGEIQVC